MTENLTVQERAAIALRNIQTYLALGDTMAQAMEAVTEVTDSEALSALNGMLHGIRATYRADLKSHDWHFEHCDDHRKYERGNLERQDLNAMQKLVDPTCDIWNSVAPTSHRRMVPA